MWEGDGEGGRGGEMVRVGVGEMGREMGRVERVGEMGRVG